MNAIVILKKLNKKLFKIIIIFTDEKVINESYFPYLCKIIVMDDVKRIFKLGKKIW